MLPWRRKWLWMSQFKNVTIETSDGGIYIPAGTEVSFTIIVDGVSSWTREQSNPAWQWFPSSQNDVTSDYDVPLWRCICVQKQLLIHQEDHLISRIFHSRANNLAGLNVNPSDIFLICFCLSEILMLICLAQLCLQGFHWINDDANALPQCQQYSVLGWILHDQANPRPEWDNEGWPDYGTPIRDRPDFWCYIQSEYYGRETRAIWC